MNAYSGDRPGPKPFTRTLAVPPGWPWDQARAAKLEALHTSPASGDTVTTLVKRVKPWAYGEPGEFVAVYVRGAAAGQVFEIDVHGRTVRVEVPSKAAREAMVRERAWQLGSALVVVLAIGGLLLLAAQRRQALEDRLTAAELKIEHQSREARAIAAAKTNARLLGELGLKDQGVDSIMRDLSHVAAVKESDARIDAFYWRKGFWAVEAHGDTPPVRDAELSLQRSTKPVRPGVWLWASKSGGDR